MKTLVPFSAILLLVSCGNRPPVIESITATPDTVLVNGQSKLEAVATDPDGDPLRYFWKSSSGILSDSTANPVTWTAPKLANTYYIYLTVKDAKDDSANASIAVTVKPGGLKELRVTARRAGVWRRGWSTALIPQAKLKRVK